MIVLTNTRTLLHSDWIDAADPVRYAVYAVIYAVWAAAVVHSFRQYRKERALESAEAVAAEPSRRRRPDAVGPTWQVAGGGPARRATERPAATGAARPARLGVLRSPSTVSYDA